MSGTDQASFAIQEAYAETSETTWEVAWTGVLDASWPVDGAFRATHGFNSYFTLWEQYTWEDGACSWSTEYPWQVTVDGVTVIVTYDTCPGWEGYRGTVNGVDSGPVYSETWEQLGTTDADDDAWAADAGDCDDARPDVHPCADDTPYDGLDADCGGDSDFDADGDGHDAIAGGGDDCDDTDRARHPGATESCGGADQDCDGVVSQDCDEDGYVGAEYGGDDCDDADAQAWPGAPEDACGPDLDCDGDGDHDCDGDGFPAYVDCDDAASWVWPGAPEPAGSGDLDCDGETVAANPESDDERRCWPRAGSGPSAPARKFAVRPAVARHLRKPARSRKPSRPSDFATAPGIRRRPSASRRGACASTCTGSPTRPRWGSSRRRWTPSAAPPPYGS